MDFIVIRTHTTILQAWKVLLTSHISWSECRPRGSKLLRTVPLKSVGSWGIILNLVLRSFRPMEQISNLSISILPPAGSTRRNNELISVDFPLPVLPTTPILFPAAKVQVIPLRTSGAFGRYLICSWSTSQQVNFSNLNDRGKEIDNYFTFKSWRSILPSCGHEAGGLFCGIMAGGSSGRCIYCLIRSTEMM